MNSYLSKLSFFALAVFAAAPCSALAQVTLQNTAGETPVTLSDTSAIVGQLFTSDSTNVNLTAFQVSLLAGVPANTTVDAFVQAWDTGTNVPTGSQIWDGNVAVTSGSAAQYSFTTGNITLDPNTTYLFGLQIDLSSDSLATLGVSATTAADYGGGSAVEFVTRAQADALGNGDWSTWGSPTGSGWINLADDTLGGGSVEGLTFVTTLTPVPEASTYAIFGVMLCLGLVLYFHRKRQIAAGAIAVSVG